MKIRNKLTGQIHEVLEGTLYAKNIFEEVTDDYIKVGEPKVEFEIKEEKEEPAQSVGKTTKKTAQSVKKQRKGVKKNGNAKTKSN